LTVCGFVDDQVADANDIDAQIATLRSLRRDEQ
jgi:hypothetical protein